MTTKRSARKKGAKQTRIVWTERALSDLEAIGDFIAADNPAAAERWVSTLMTSAERARDAPMAGRRVPEVGREDVRELFERTYRIVYRVRSGRVEILTVFEGRKRFPRDIDHDEP